MKSYPSLLKLPRPGGRNYHSYHCGSSEGSSLAFAARQGSIKGDAAKPGALTTLARPSPARCDAREHARAPATSPLVSSDRLRVLFSEPANRHRALHVPAARSSSPRRKASLPASFSPKAAGWVRAPHNTPRKPRVTRSTMHMLVSHHRYNRVSLPRCDQVYAVRPCTCITQLNTKARPRRAHNGKIRNSSVAEQQSSSLFMNVLMWTGCNRACCQL